MNIAGHIELAGVVGRQLDREMGKVMQRNSPGVESAVVSISR